MLKLSRNIYTLEIPIKFKDLVAYIYNFRHIIDLFFNDYEWQLPTLLNKFLL